VIVNSRKVSSRRRTRTAYWKLDFWWIFWCSYSFDSHTGLSRCLSFVLVCFCRVYTVQYDRRDQRGLKSWVWSSTRIHVTNKGYKSKKLTEMAWIINKQMASTKRNDFRSSCSEVDNKIIIWNFTHKIYGNRERIMYKKAQKHSSKNKEA